MPRTLLALAAALPILLALALALPARADERVREAERAKRLAAMKSELGEGYHYAGWGPYCIAGSGDAREFQRVVEGTVKGCHGALRKMYFPSDPARLLSVYLFADAPTYRQNALKLFGDRNPSHFGYYKPSQRALVMNIATGTGTLVHEMVHPMIEHDFPRCPTWFNEGLASLYEQCRFRGEELEGLANWRLPGLQSALRAGRALSLPELVATDYSTFHGEKEGANYAQARYLCLYLQEQGKLKEFYRKFRAGAGDDPTGRKFLEEVTGAKLEEFEPRWRTWALALRRE